MTKEFIELTPHKGACVLVMPLLVTDPTFINISTSEWPLSGEYFLFVDSHDRVVTSNFCFLEVLLFLTSIHPSPWPSAVRYLFPSFIEARILSTSSPMYELLTSTVVGFIVCLRDGGDSCLAPTNSCASELLTNSDQLLHL